MKWLQNLLSKLKRKPLEHAPLPFDRNGEEIKHILADIEKPLELLKPRPKGRVIKQTQTAEFNPIPMRRGGRIVKVMPRELQRIKQAQEKVEDDGNQPTIEDLED